MAWPEQRRFPLPSPGGPGGGGRHGSSQLQVALETDVRSAPPFTDSLQKPMLCQTLGEADTKLGVLFVTSQSAGFSTHSLKCCAKSNVFTLMMSSGI